MIRPSWAGPEICGGGGLQKQGGEKKAAKAEERNGKENPKLFILCVPPFLPTRGGAHFTQADNLNGLKDTGGESGVAKGRPGFLRALLEFLDREEEGPSLPSTAGKKDPHRSESALDDKCGPLGKRTGLNAKIFNKRVTKRKRPAEWKLPSYEGGPKEGGEVRTEDSDPSSGNPPEDKKHPCLPTNIRGKRGGTGALEKQHAKKVTVAGIRTRRF